tara:strand:- start:1138 stop:1851 length:714 start_codon:yes stop_codon:yes gene_type:complete
MISLYLPFYNEKDIIEENTIKVLKKLEEIKQDFEIILVDDGSTDSSSKIADQLPKKHKEIRVLHYQGTPTRRENLAKSFKEAKGDTIVFMDIDLATSLEHLPMLIEALKKNDIVIGSRKVPGSQTDRELFRKALSLGYTTFVKTLFKSKIHDFQCGFKAFKKDIILKLVEEAGYDNTLKRGWAWDVEILIRAEKKHLRIKELPVKWTCGTNSSLNIGRELNVIPYFLELRKKLYPKA